MAGREKKPALLKKQVLTPVPPKEADTLSEASVTRINSNKPDVELVTQSDVVPTAKAIKKPRTRKPIKKNLKINFKTRAKNTKKLKLTKSIFKTNKLTLDTKKVSLLKNGTKNKKTQKLKLPPDNEFKTGTAEEDLQPPILEPMIPFPEESHTPKKELKKRLTKKHVGEDSTESIDTNEKKQKLAETTHAQTVEELLNEVANDLQIDLNALVKKPIKKTVTKKIKTDNTAKSNAKPRKVTPKKLKPDNVRLRRPIKGQSLIDSFCKQITLDSEAQSVINNLDLNVTKAAKKPVNKKRRHSIEKISVLENQGETTFEQPFVFSNSRRSASPKSKRNSKIRKSVESTVTKRLNPYATRSDSPARILRNGKHRKLKDSPLLDGLNCEYKKRRRLCSDYSGSEISKCSGYLSESDSSFSDLASVQENGANDIDSPKDEGRPILKKGILDSIKIQAPASNELSPLQNLNIKQISTKFTAILKRSLSTDASQILDPTISDDLKPKFSEDMKMRLSEDIKPKLDEKMSTFIIASPTKLSNDVKNKLIENMKTKLSEVSVNSFTDTNYNDLKLEIKTELITEDTVAKVEIQAKTEKTKCDGSNNIKSEKISEEDEKFMSESIAINPSEKVPDKALILDSMKLTFNDLNEDTDKRSTRSSKRALRLEEKNLETVSPMKFYGPEPASECVTATAETVSLASETISPISETVYTSSESVPSTSEITSIITENKTPTSGIDLFTSGISPSTSGIDSSTLGIGSYVSETDLPPLETGSLTAEIDSATSETELPTLEAVLTISETVTSSIAAPETGNIRVNITREDEHQSFDDSNKDSEKHFLQENSEIVDVIAQNTCTETDLKDTEIAPENPFEEDKEVERENVVEEDKEIEEDKKVEEEFNVEENAHIDESEFENNLENEIENNSLLMEAQDISVSAEINGVSQVPNEKEIDSIITQNVNEQPLIEMPLLEESPEEQAIKENILSALGLQSLRAAEEAKQRDKEKIQTKPETYTGTLKTVIKLNRQPDKKKRNPLKMTLQKSKSRHLREEGDKSDGANGRSDGENSCYKVMKEGSNSAGWRQGSHSSDSADGSSEHASDGDVPAQDGESSGTKALVIPEKASSFSIHPDRLCSDECAYCFGKFGLFDTPLHIAQIKSEERQNKILENEIYLTRDSCLCDACYRHVDRRLNSATAGFNNKSMKRTGVMSNLPRQNDCHVLGCDRESSHVLRRKWLMKMRKSVSKVINIDLDNPGLHSIPICSEHYAAVEHLMICALCKRRLARNHIHYLGFELDTLNSALEKEGIPVKLTDKPVVCKLCRYFATLLLKESGEIKSNTANFFRQYKKRLLHFHDVEVMDEAEAEEPIAVPLKEKAEKELPKKKKSKTSKNCSNKNISHGATVASSAAKEKPDQSRVPSNSENGESRDSTPSDGTVDIETLIPNMTLECASDSEEINKSEVPHNKTVFKKLHIPESVREAVEISKIMKITRKPNAVDRLGSNPSISVRQLFPGEEDLPLHANIDFNTVKERTAEGWEKCSCTIQYDVDTKHLWQELQKPYGNQSSFLRHLILLEKYFRNGDLTLSPNASHHAVNYSVSVQNRLRAYDNIPTNSLPMQPLTMLPFNQVKKSQSGIITTKEPVGNLTSIVNAANLPKNTPISISQLNPNLLTQLSVRQKTPGVPPGLISLQPGTNRPIAPIGKLPQKFKLPIGKNWRPTLIPVTPKTQALCVNPGEKRISGLVQVISGGKPYHISLSDYNKMCILKKNHDLKQKALEAKMLKQRDTEMSSSSLLKPVIPRKPKMSTVTTSAAAVSTVVGKAVTVTAITKDVSQLAELKAISADKSKEIVSTLPENKPVKSIMLLPKIPKSLTVIPQTVARKPLQASSPTLSITTKPSTSKS